LLKEVRDFSRSFNFMIRTKRPQYSRVLLKLSGEVLGGEAGNGISAEAVNAMAEQIC
jgi:hypothetical protein